MAVIKVKGEKYKVQFAYGSFKILLQKYNKNKLSDLDDLLRKLLVLENQEPTFEWFELLGNVILSGIEFANKDLELEITADDVVDELLHTDVVFTSAIISEFSEALPKPEVMQKKKKSKPKKS